MAVNLLGIFVVRDYYAFLNTVYINFCYIALFYFTLNYAAEDEDNYKKIYRHDNHTRGTDVGLRAPAVGGH